MLLAGAFAAAAAWLPAQLLPQVPCHWWLHLWHAGHPWLAAQLPQALAVLLLLLFPLPLRLWLQHTPSNLEPAIVGRQQWHVN